MFYELTHSVDLAEVGTIPQIDQTISRLAREDIDGLDDIVMTPFEFPDRIPTLGELKLDDDAALTDLLHASFLSGLNGFLVSPRLKTLFDEYDLTQARYYEATVSDAEERLHPYHFLFFVSARDLIDYAASDFEITDTGKKRGEPVHLESFDAQVACKRQAGTLKSVRPRRVQLTENTDAFKLPMQASIFVSQELTDALTQRAMNGLELTPSDIEISPRG